MAKPFAEQSGSGLHVHLSLLDRDGRNLFGETPDGERHLRHAVRGLQDLMAESMLVFAPNANSFRRLRPLTYAPTAPTWGWNNRTVALRIPPGGPAARRIEHRVAGSDANPYLVLAAVLAGVLEGLESRQEPNEPIVGNAYANSPALLPLSWDAAIAAFRAGEHLPRWFGERFCRLFAAVRQGERDRFHTRDHAHRVRVVPDHGLIGGSDQRPAARAAARSLAQRRPWRDRLGIEDQMKQRRSSGRNGFLERRCELCSRLHPRAMGAVGPRQSREVRVGQRGGRDAARMLALLVHADGAVHAVVDYELRPAAAGTGRRSPALARS